MNDRPDATIYWKGDEYIWLNTQLPCCLCRKPSMWASISFEAPFCSAKCADKMWDDYFFQLETMKQEQELNAGPNWTVRCGWCSAVGPNDINKVSAVRAWNRRAKHKPRKKGKKTNANPA